MLFEQFTTAWQAMLWGGFILAFIMGVVVNKTNFCTMGAVSDMVNIGDMSRMRSWLLAIAVALLGVTILEWLQLLNTDNTFPPYRGNQVIWLENILGGLLFGIGMTLASGCGNKTLIRIGGGNLKSVVVFVIIATIAYYMTNPFPGTDVTLFSLLFYDWIRPAAINLGTNHDLASVLVGHSEQLPLARLVTGVVIALFLLFYVFKAADFRNNRQLVVAGLVVGMVVIGGWMVTGTIQLHIADDGNYRLTQYYTDWDMYADSTEGKPADGASLGTQSYTFINPIGQTFDYVSGGFASKLLTFGILSVAGIILGSLFWSIISRSFRIEWFSSVSDLINHVVGAILMGFGGVLALGCTIGQGITGVSTMAIGSILTLVAIIFASALTMKVNYYRMVYEDEATILQAIIAGLADMHLLPQKLRKLDAV